MEWSSVKDEMKSFFGLIVALVAVAVLAVAVLATDFIFTTEADTDWQPDRATITPGPVAYSGLVADADSSGWSESGVISADGIDYEFEWNDEENEHNLTDASIRALAETGRLCEVLGHQWREGRPGEGYDPDLGLTLKYADYHPGTFYRTCTICGTCESRFLSDWSSEAGDEE